MLGIDTNVLVRYITQDDVIQSKIAGQIMEKECSSENPGIINQIVLCEVVWVLRQAYEYKKEDIVNVLNRIICCAELDVLNRDCAWNALQEYRDGNADFSDYFIGQINKLHKADRTVTFDKKATENQNFLLLK